MWWGACGLTNLRLTWRSPPAIASSLWDKPVRADLVLIGELGLSGELRMVGQINARLREAASLGFKTAIVPHRLHNKERWPAGIEGAGSPLPQTSP